MSSTPLIAPTASAATAVLVTDSYPSIVLTASNIASTEYVDVFIVDANGVLVEAATWDGRTHAIDDTNGAVVLPGGATYSITKSVTVSAAAGVCWSPSKFY